MTKRKYINTMISSFAMLVSSMLVASEASAEFVAQSDDRPPSPSRLIFPDTQEGYHVLAGDLHLHTVFSDGSAWPTLRLAEAAHDGLKFVSFTEHDIITPKIRDTGTNKNRSYEIGRAFIDSGMLGLKGMRLSLGAEITRGIGHFNCHFLKDANALNPAKIHYSTIKQTGTQLQVEVDWNRTGPVEKDLEARFREAKRQGGICQWNHPTFPSSIPGDAVVTPFLERMFKEGLLSGIEVAQSDFIHPAAMDVALKYNLYIAATTDAHLGTTMEQEAAGMDHRVTTLFLTRGDDESAFKDALEKRRTVGLFRDTFFGTKENVGAVINSVLKMSFTKYSPSEMLIGNMGEMEIKNSGPIDIELEILQPGFRLLNYPRFVKVAHGSKITLKALQIDGPNFKGIKVRVINSLVTSHDQLEFFLQAQPFDLNAITGKGTLGGIPADLDGWM